MEGVPGNVFAVIDLYGVCGQASVVQGGPGPGRAGPPPALLAENSLASSLAGVLETSQAVSLPEPGLPPSHRFSPSTCPELEVGPGGQTVRRTRGPGPAPVVSVHALEPDQLWEVI